MGVCVQGLLHLRRDDLTAGPRDSQTGAGHGHAQDARPVAR